MNRLNLDFSIPTSDARAHFIRTYLQKLPNPTDEELETCANYILWGKDADGKNIHQKKIVQLEPRHKTWVKPPPDSLNELMENPLFNEHSILYKGEPQTRIPPPNFQRETELARAPEEIKPVLQDLFDQIDTTNLIIQLYEVRIKKRESADQNLLDKFSTILPTLQSKADSLSEYNYLKMRHTLVNLRKTQYTIKDTYAPLRPKDFKVTLPRIDPETLPVFEVDIPVFPLGIVGDDPLKKAIFQNNIDPHDLTLSQLKKISNFIWNKTEQRKKLLAENEAKSKTPTPNCAGANFPKLPFFDFENPAHLYKLISNFSLIAGIEAQDKELNPTKLLHVDATTNSFIQTLFFYIKRAKLKDWHYEILRLKLQEVPNQKIALVINEIFGKGYSSNYISTIFTKTIIPAVAAAAIDHRIYTSELPFPENFKLCPHCGRWQLRNTTNFSRKEKSTDGLASTCKSCVNQRRAEARKAKKQLKTTIAGGSKNESE